MRRNGTLALCISALCGRVNGSGGSFEGLKAVADMIARQQTATGAEVEHQAHGSLAVGGKSAVELEADAHAQNFGGRRGTFARQAHGSDHIT